MKTSENNAKSSNQTKISRVFERRRSSAHLQVAENELDLRSNTLIGLSKQQLQKFVNFDKEYFNQLSKSSTLAFALPKTEEIDNCVPKATPSLNSAYERTTGMKFRRTHSSLTQETLIKRLKEQENVYQKAYQRSNTLPDFDSPKKSNLPPLMKLAGNNRPKPQRIAGYRPTVPQSTPQVGMLPPITLTRKNGNYAENYFENEKENKKNEFLENGLASGETEDDNNTSKDVYVIRHGAKKANKAFTGELKLHPNQNDFYDIIDRSKKAPVTSNSTTVLPNRALKEMGFLVSSTGPMEMTKDQARESKSNFEIRKEYGKNLEINWFKNFLMQNKLKEGNDDLSSSKFDMRLELFYSPEPDENDQNIAESDVDSNCNENIDVVNDPIESGDKIVPKKKHLLDISGLFSSTDVLTGEDNELDRDSQSEIEIVLKDNELVQKKTKHKMRKKRRKKAKRCKEILGPKDVEVEIPQLSDKELRALRLNIKKKKAAPVLTGKRKFLQVANAVFVAVQFRRILFDLRNKKRKSRARKSRKRKKVKWQSKTGHKYEDYERLLTPPTLREKFLQEIGMDLSDIENLKIDDTEIEAIKAQDCGNKRPSKYWVEAEKACKEDVERLLKDGNRTLKRFKHLRHHSAPSLSKEELLIEMKEKKNRKRDRSRSVKRIKSSSKKATRRGKSPNAAPKCSCSNRAHASRNNSICNTTQICPSTEDAENPKVKQFVFHRSQVLKRRPSLDHQYLNKASEIDLYELLRGIDIPAKDVKIQIILRKMRKQRRLKEQVANISLNPEPEVSEDESTTSVEPDTESSSSDSDEYSIAYTTPFVSSGVAWNQQKTRHRTFTKADVDRELKHVTQFFLEMKDCSYLRFTGINQAIVERLDEIMSG